MKALVTGGAGFIGSHIVEELVKSGNRVSVIDNLTSGKMSNIPTDIINQIEFVVGDIRETRALRDIMKDCDVVFHQAAVVSIPETFQNPIKCTLVNDVGSLYIFQTARELEVQRVIYASSCTVYNTDTNVNLNEDMALNPMSPYAISKLTVENYASLYHSYFDLEVIGLRYFNVYGPRQSNDSEYSGVISRFLNCAVNNTRPIIYGTGDQYRDFIYVKDIVEANIIAAMADNIRGGIFNVGTGTHITIKNLWDEICKITKTNTSPKFKPDRFGDNIFTSVANTEYCKSILGFTSKYKLIDGLNEFVNWYNKTN